MSIAATALLLSAFTSSIGADEKKLITALLDAYTSCDLAVKTDRSIKKMAGTCFILFNIEGHSF